MSTHRKLFLFLPFLVLSSCLNDKGDEIISWSHEIKPIILTNCATYGCHVPGFVQGDYTSYDGVKSKVDKGTFYLNLFVIKNMPPFKPLTDYELEKINLWLKQGAGDN